MIATSNLRRVVVFAVSLTLLASSLTGCRDSSTRVEASPVEFGIDADLFSEYDEDFYDWNTALDQARVEFRVRNFNEGAVRLRLYDADGFEVFDRFYYDHEYHCCFSPGSEQLDIAFTEAGGTPGRWTVQIEYFDFTGHLYLLID